MGENEIEASIRRVSEQQHHAPLHTNDEIRGSLQDSSLTLRGRDLIAQKGWGNVPTRTAAMQQMQQVYGNRAVQRQVQRSQGHSRECSCSGCTARSVRPVQRYCGTPGCTDPDCHDEKNHGFQRVYNLRGRTVYSSVVSPSDLDKGTETTKATRDYVNAPTMAYPQQVAMEYSARKGKGRGRTGRGVTEFINAPLARGQKADAGHIKGRQLGGLGDDPAGVFPQNPQQNRGNYLNGEPTRPLWRAHEDTIHDLAEGGSDVAMAVTLRDRPRVQYEQFF
jgi:hypothetical protein